MSKEVANSGPLPGLASFAAGLNNVSTSLKSGATGTPFLRMTRGEWMYGQDDTEVEEGSLWAVNPVSLQHGWSSWRAEAMAKRHGAKLLGEDMVPVSEPKALKSGLPAETQGTDEEDPEPHDWVEQMSVQLVCVAGEDEGQAVLYKSSSRGFMNLMSEYTDQLVKRIGSGNPEIVAIVELETESYKHKTYGKTYTPKWKYDSWRTQDDATPVGASEPEVAAEAVTEAVTEAEPEATEAEAEAPAAEEEEPKPRRRRRSS